MKAYTSPESEIPYTGIYPNMDEFRRPFETGIEVGEGKGGISKDGKPLISQGFGECSALILRNHSNLESALFHNNHHRLNREQIPVIEELMKDFLYSLNISSVERDELVTCMEDIVHYADPKNHGVMSRQDFQVRMEELNNEGSIQARHVYGDNSIKKKNTTIGRLLCFLGVDVMDDLIVNPGEASFGVAYRPNESRIYVDLPEQKKALKFHFSD
jgi:hypothetical protein